MGTSYELQNDGRIVFARYWDNVTKAEVTDLYRKYLKDPEFRFDRPHLADISGVKDADAGFAEVFSLFSMYARSYAPTGEILRVAIYAPDDVTFGLARIFQNLAESSGIIETAIFKDLEEARIWALEQASKLKKE